MPFIFQNMKKRIEEQRVKVSDLKTVKNFNIDAYRSIFIPGKFEGSKTHQDIMQLMREYKTAIQLDRFNEWLLQVADKLESEKYILIIAYDRRPKDRMLDNVDLVSFLGYSIVSLDSNMVEAIFIERSINLESKLRTLRNLISMIDYSLDMNVDSVEYQVCHKMDYFMSDILREYGYHKADEVKPLDGYDENQLIRYIK